MEPIIDLRWSYVNEIKILTIAKLCSWDIGVKPSSGGDVEPGDARECGLGAVIVHSLTLLCVMLLMVKKTCRRGSKYISNY